MTSDLDNSRRVEMKGVSARTYARVAGLLFLLSVLGGGFGEAYVPAKLIVSGDANATANNIHALGTLFRLGFAAYLVEAVCDVCLALVFYVLLKPVHKYLSLLAAFFGLVSTAVFAVAELFYFAALSTLSGAPYLNAFSPDQLNTLALLSLKLYGLGAGIFMVFYGVPTAIRGYLMYRSGYFPRLIGLLLILAGFGFIAKNLALVLTPSYASDLFLFPMLLAAVALMAWLLIKGIDVAEWDSQTGTR